MMAHDIDHQCLGAQAHPLTFFRCPYFLQDHAILLVRGIHSYPTWFRSTRHRCVTVTVDVVVE